MKSSHRPVRLCSAGNLNAIVTRQEEARWAEQDSGLHVDVLVSSLNTGKAERSLSTLSVLERPIAFTSSQPTIELRREDKR